MKTNFRMLYEHDIVNQVRDLMVNTSNLKTQVFKSLIIQSPFNKSAGASYLAFINGYLQKWEMFATDMENKIRTASKPVAAQSIGYDNIKAFIHDKYDYDAVTKFVDGVVRGINDGKMKSKNDIDDFFTMTARKAFGNRDMPTSTAGLLDSVMGNEIFRNTPNDYDLRMFKALQHSDKIFHWQDRVELFDNVKEVLNFLADGTVLNQLLHGSNTGLYVGAVNSITDFVVYALTIYAVRIYSINMFAYPFIEAANRVTFADSPVSESVVSLPHANDLDISREVHILRDADDAEYRSISDINKFKALMFDACIEIGANGFIEHFDDRRRVNSDLNFGDSQLNSNIFVQKLFSNDLYVCITSTLKKSVYSDYEPWDTTIKEANWTIKSLITSKGSEASSKNAFMAIVRGMEYGSKARDYQRLFADLMVLAVNISNDISFLVINYCRRSEIIANNKKAQLNDAVLLSENSSLLQDLYSDLIYLFLQKARDIETKYNKVSGGDFDAKLSLNLPKLIMTDNTTTNDITNAVPDTLKIPTELSDLYALPSFEYFQFYDEAVKTQYSLADDLYYSEAFNLSELINKIKAWLKGIGNRLNAWWGNNQRKQAIEWAIKYGDSVTKKDFSNMTMEVLPFKNNGSQENIDLAGIMDKLVDGLNKFKVDVVASPESVDTYIKSLYPDNAVYDWFKNESKKGEAAAKFHSFVLFKNASNASTSAEPVVKITGPEIAKRCHWWVDTCKGANKIYSELVAINNKIIQAQDKIQQAVAGITKDAGNTKETLSAAAPSQDNKNNGSRTSSGNDVKNNPGSQNADKATNVSVLLSEIQLVITRIYDPVVLSLIHISEPTRP